MSTFSETRGVCWFLVFISLLGVVFLSIAVSQHKPSPLNAKSEKKEHPKAPNLDGTFRHKNVKWFGAAETAYRRQAPSNYEPDGFSVSTTYYVNTSRQISNALGDQVQTLKDARDVSVFTHAFAQTSFDHDVLETETQSGEKAETIVEPVPICDPNFDKNCTGNVTIGITRSRFLDGPTPRELVNSQTSWFDASFVYGQSNIKSINLRTFKNGRMKTDTNNLLPTVAQTNVSMANPKHLPPTVLRACGDVRCNESPILLSVHTIFVREHNRLAGWFAQKYPYMSDEEIFTRVRGLVAKIQQKLLYEEWLPAVTGRVIDKSHPFNDDADPAITLEFDMVFRAFHSAIADTFLVRDSPLFPSEPSKHLPLFAGFFNPDYIYQVGIDSILQGGAEQCAERVDTQVVDSLRNVLFGPAHDLLAFNIMRGRDHGLPKYNDYLTSVGLTPKTSFAQITTDLTTQRKLAETYGTPDGIDLIIGIIAEDPEVGSSVGPTLTRAIVEQMKALRAADREFYTRDKYFTAYFKDYTTQTLIKHNTQLTNFPANPFKCK